MSTHPVVTIVHAIPGRVRARLSHAPRDEAAFCEAILGHEGLESATFSTVTKSVLVRFDPKIVRREEAALRIALALSLDLGGVPVRAFGTPEEAIMSNTAAYAGLMILASGLAFWAVPKNTWTQRMGQLAGVGTAAAVLDHGWREVRERGHFDPEVLSLGYLLTALVRGNYLKAAAITWMTAFGRHLVEAPRRGVEIEPLKTSPEGADEPRYEVVVRPAMQNDAPLVAGLQGVVKYALTAEEGRRGANLLEEFRHLSRIHGEVVEGLGATEHGIPMRFT